MKTLLVFALIALAGNGVFGQVNAQNQDESNQLNATITQLEERIEIFRAEKEQLREDLLVLRRNYNMLSDELESYKNQAQTDISSLNAALNASDAELEQTAGNLGTRIDNIEQAAVTGTVDSKAGLYTVYWIIIVAVLVGFAFWFTRSLKKQDARQKADFDTRLKNTQQSLEGDMTLLSNEFRKMKDSLEALGKKVDMISGRKQMG